MNCIVWKSINYLEGTHTHAFCLQSHKLEVQGTMGLGKGFLRNIKRYFCNLLTLLVLLTLSVLPALLALLVLFALPALHAFLTLLAFLAFLALLALLDLNLFVCEVLADRTVS